MPESKIEKTNDFWDKLEHSFIKEREQIILYLLILIVFLIIPFKILSYGWTPPDDAKRHVAFSTLDAKWSDILVIDEKFDTDHNAGWHQCLRFLYKNLGCDKQDLMLFSVVGLFLLINFCGMISVPSPICWCVALLILLHIDDAIVYRLILGRPYIVSCAATLIILRLWGVRPQEEEKIAFLRKSWARYVLTLIAFSLGVWIHGSWYIFLLVPVSFFIAGKTKEAIELTVCIIASTLIGAMLTGNFCHFLYYHFMATFSIYSEQTYNWLMVAENACGTQKDYWAIFAAIILYLCSKKNKYHLRNIAGDPIAIMVLLCWMCSICVIRFWIDWGRMALLIWFSYRIYDLIETSASLKIQRIRYCLTLFVFVALYLTFTNDGFGRFTKPARTQPIDFYSEAVRNELKGWEPQPGGIVYSDNMNIFYEHFYEYPKAPWKYILGFESAIMRQEDRQVYRNIGYNEGRVPEDYLPWINKMTEKDRMILFFVPGNFPQMEWKRGNRTFWIGRLKTASATSDISKP